MEDSTTQNVLATFIGSFLFSLVGIIALTTGAYGEHGRVVLFIVTIGVIALIVITLLRWIDHLSRLGRVTETTRRVEQATIDAIEKWQASPSLGGKVLPKDTPPPKDSGKSIQSDKVGYVQNWRRVSRNWRPQSNRCLGDGLLPLVFKPIPTSRIEEAAAMSELELLFLLRLVNSKPA